MTDPLDVAAGDDRPRPVLLGEAPSKHGDRYHHFPLSGRPARVLCELAGIPPQAEGSTYGRWTWALYDNFECRNLHDRYADATPWRVASARDRAAAILDEMRAEHVAAGGALTSTDGSAWTPPRVIVCLGRRVQAAVFGALNGDIRQPIAVPGRWGGALFGNFGVWAAPWQIHTPVIRQVCARCGQHRTFGNAQQLCPGDAESFPPVGTLHAFADHRETRWAPHVVTIPHPSGLNRLLNDEAHRARCGEVLRRALELAAPPDTVPA